MEPIFRFTLNTDTGEIKKTVITEYDYIEGNRWSSGVKNQPYYRYKYSGAYYYAYVHDFDRYINRRVYLWEDNIERVKAIMASSLLASIEEFKNKEEKYKKTLSLMREMDNYHAGKGLKTVDPTTKNDSGVDKTFYEQMVEYCNEHFLVLVEKDVWEDAEKALTTKNDLEVDCISRADAIRVASGYCHPSNVAKELAKLPSVTPQEPQSFEWCETCKEYDQEKHCCHRWTKVIRNTVEEMKQEQEPILDKINKMKSEIADSLEFWDYSPNNNPLARDMLETLTNFWGDMRERGT